MTYSKSPEHKISGLFVIRCSEQHCYVITATVFYLKLTKSISNTITALAGILGLGLRCP